MPTGASCSGGNARWGHVRDRTGRGARIQWLLSDLDGSALDRITAMATIDRRKHVRISTGVPATVVVGSSDRVEGVIQNLSQSGLFLRAPLSPARERVARVQLIIKPDHKVCEMVGKVAWTSGSGIGLSFTEVNEVYELFMNDLLRASDAPSDRRLKAELERIFGDASVDID